MAFSGEKTFVVARKSLAFFFFLQQKVYAYVEVNCNLLNICPASGANSTTNLFLKKMWL